MLRYSRGPLSAAATNFLHGRQLKVDAKPNRQSKYAEAKRLFAMKNNAAFTEVKATLSEMAPGDQACFYCERDRYRDIEHIRPKRHYPEQCFNWQNYVYACTICNQDAKRDTYAVFGEDGNIISFDRSKPFEDPLPQGDAVIIDIRSEDPLEFIQLEFETGIFVPIGTSIEQNRARYTITLFDLNNDYLSRSRRNSVIQYREYLGQLAQASNDGDINRIARLLSEIKLLSYPTVLVEMRRQQERHAWIPPLLEALPAAVGQRP